VACCLIAPASNYRLVLELSTAHGLNHTRVDVSRVDKVFTADVCFSRRYLKNNAARITELDMKMFHDEF